MNERAAKVGVWAYLLLTLVSLALAIAFFLTDKDMSTVTMIGLPVWMAYTVFVAIKSLADLIGAQRRTANFTHMLDRWQDTFGSRVQALALLAFMTLAVGGIKILVPIVLVQF